MINIFIQNNISSEDLLTNILNSHYHITNIELIYNEFGKPYLKNNPEIYFNISNKKNLTVCAISDNEIGVDLEYICYKEKVIFKVCNELEINFINNAQNKELEFTKIWVMKESYLKMLGLGLSYGLKNVDSMRIKDKIDIICNENYIIAICDKGKFD